MLKTDLYSTIKSEDSEDLLLKITVTFLTQKKPIDGIKNSVLDAH